MTAAGPDHPSLAVADDPRDRAWKAVEELEAAWARGDHRAAAVWDRHAEDDPVVVAALIKADLRRRFDRGDRPAIREYLDRFAPLARDSERVVSLVYEEFCLREENGEAPDPDAFCVAYATWGDSLASQLRYHRLLSQVAGGPRSQPRYPALGERFHQFRLRDLLGKGGSAVVFLAEDEALGNRPTAVKISADRGEEPEIMGRLDHPRIVAVQTVVRDPERRLRGLCMPYRPSLPLNMVLDRMKGIPPARRAAIDFLRAAVPPGSEPLPAGGGWAGFPVGGSYSEAVAWIGMVVAEGLDHAHRRGILHRDIKPANILITEQEGPQLLDFNLAHSRGSSPEQAEEAHRGGTLPYMAPEQLDAFLDEARWDSVGSAADLYSLGLVLREMLVGERPEAPQADISMPRAIRELRDWRGQSPGPISPRNPATSPGLEAIIRKCLAPEPARRYPDARALAEDFRLFLAREKPRHVHNPSPRERLRHWAHRNRTRLVAVALLGAVVFSAAHFAWDEFRESPWRRGAELLKAGRVVEAEDQIIQARRQGGPVPASAHELVAKLRRSRRGQAAEFALRSPIEGEAHRAAADRAIALGYQVDESDVTEWLNVVNGLLDRAADDPGALALAGRYLAELDAVAPDRHRVLQAHGVLALRLGQLPRAAEFLGRALEAPSLAEEKRDFEVEIRRQLAGVFIKLGRFDQALAETDRAWGFGDKAEYRSTEAFRDARFAIAWERAKLHVEWSTVLVKDCVEELGTPAGLRFCLSPYDPGADAVRGRVVRLDESIHRQRAEALHWIDQALASPHSLGDRVAYVRAFREGFAPKVMLPHARSARTAATPSPSFAE